MINENIDENPFTCNKILLNKYIKYLIIYIY